MGQMKALQERAIEVSRMLGSPNVDWCPCEGHVCWRQRGLEPYAPLTNEASADECVNCWTHYILTGE